MNKGRGYILKGLLQGGVAIMVLTLYAGLTSCGSKSVNAATISGMQARNDNAWNRRIIDSCVHILHTGDLVLRTGIDASSYVLSRMNLHDKTYSHCGLVIVEHGYPFVYHSIGGEDNPDACLRRDSASFFFSPRNNFGFGIARYDMNAAQRDSMQKVVYRFYKEKRKFDLDFDLKTDDKLYCAEFVYKALNIATKDTAYIKAISFVGHSYVGVDNLFLNRHANMICRVKFK